MKKRSFPTPPELWALILVSFLAARAGVVPIEEGWRFLLLWLLGPCLVISILTLDRNPKRNLEPGLILGVSFLALLTSQDNFQAGSLAICLPPWLALASRYPRWLSHLLLAVALGALFWLDSRGALAAGLVGLAFYFLGSSHRPRLFLAAFGAIFLTSPFWSRLNIDGEPLWRRFLLEDQVEGLSLSSALTGRFEIWRRDLWMLEDMPWLGVGPGSFSPALSAGYPGVPSLDQAHQGFLHIALAVGWPGLALFLIFFARVSFGLITAWRFATPEKRRWISAFGGALLAGLLFSSAEAWIYAHPASLMTWAWLGLAFRLTLRGRPEILPTRPSLWVPALVLLLSTPAIAISLTPPSSALFPEKAARQTLRALSQAAPLFHTLSSPAETSREAHAELSEGIRSGARGATHLAWLEGLVAWRADDEAKSIEAWSRLIDASPDRLPLLTEIAIASQSSTRPSLQPLARQATERWPGQPEAWRFAAYLAGSRESAVEAWRRLVSLNPWDGKAWLTLADLSISKDPDAALEAYAQACVHGDVGANACSRGGRLAEALAAPLRAGALYRRSRWAPVRALADSLQLDQAPTSRPANPTGNEISPLPE